MSSTNGSITDISESTFTIEARTYGPPIAVTYPTATGVSKKRGETLTVTWQQPSLTGNMGVYVTSDNGATLRYLGSALASANQYNWVIPTTFALGTNYKIKIVSVADGTQTDMSDNPFAITSAVTCRVTAPNGGEFLVMGAPYLVKWTQTGMTGNAGVYIYNEAGTTSVKYLGSGPAVDGQKSFTIPTTAVVPGIVTATKYRMVVAGSGGATDMSDAAFTIIRQPLVTGPAGGGTYGPGNVLPVTFDMAGLSGNVGVYLANPDTGALVKYIGSATVASGVRNYTMPTGAGAVTPGTYKIYVVCSNYSAVSALSGFTITVN